MDNDERKLWQRLCEATERTAEANERIVQLATEERDTGDSMRTPPYCPFCGTVDPECRSVGGEGRMSEFVFVATAECCGAKIAGVPQGWSMYKTMEEVLASREGWE